MLDLFFPFRLRLDGIGFISVRTWCEHRCQLKMNDDIDNNCTEPDVNSIIVSKWVSRPYFRIGGAVVRIHSFIHWYYLFRWPCRRQRCCAEKTFFFPKKISERPMPEKKPRKSQKRNECIHIKKEFEALQNGHRRSDFISEGNKNQFEFQRGQWAFTFPWISLRFHRFDKFQLN